MRHVKTVSNRITAKQKKAAIFKITPCLNSYCVCWARQRTLKNSLRLMDWLESAMFGSKSFLAASFMKQTDRRWGRSSL